MDAISLPSTLMLAIGITHQSLGLFIPEIREGYFSALRKGFDGVSDGHGHNNPSRMSGEFYFQLGNLFLLLGYTMRLYARQTKKKLPKEVGYALVGISFFSDYIHPKSGWWTLLVPGSFIIYSNSK